MVGLRDRVSDRRCSVPPEPVPHYDDASCGHTAHHDVGSVPFSMKQGKHKPGVSTGARKLSCSGGRPFIRNRILSVCGNTRFGTS